MRITESTLRKIVREEIVGQAVREGKMTIREGRRLMNESNEPEEVKSMGLTTGGDDDSTKFEKGKVYDLAAEKTFKIRPEEMNGNKSMSSRIIYARRSTNFMLKSYYDEANDKTTTELVSPKGDVLGKKAMKGDINATHGKAFAELRYEIPDDDMKKMNAAGFK
jgi:hypothetical protein